MGLSFYTTVMFLDIKELQIAILEKGHLKN